MSEQVVLNYLRMENFGCFVDRELSFTSGLNRIVGPNDSGKSTVLKALQTALFVSGDKRSGNVSSFQNRSAGKPSRLTLKFSIRQKQFTLIRNYGTAPDQLSDSDGIDYKGDEIDLKLSRYFGSENKDFLIAAFYFSSYNSSAIEQYKNELKAAIEKPVFSGFNRVEADKCLIQMEQEIRFPGNDGICHLELLDRRIASHLKEKGELDRRLEKMLADKDELDDVLEKIAVCDKEMPELESNIVGLEAYNQLDQKMAGLEERLQDHLSKCSRAEQAWEDLGRVEKELDNIILPPDDERDQLDEKQNEFTEAVDSSKRQMDALIARRGVANRNFLLTSLLLVFLCFTLVILRLGFFNTGPVADIFPYTIPVMAIIWIARMVAYLSYYRKKKNSSITFHQNVARLDEFYEELNKQCNLQAADPVKAIYEAETRRRGLAINSKNLRETISLLSDQKGLDHLNKIKDQLSTEVAQLNTELTPLARFSSMIGKLDEFKENLIAMRVRYNAFRERSALLNERCSPLVQLQNRSHEISSDLETSKKQYAAITEQLEIIRITKMALHQAADQLIDQTFETYAADASAIFAQLTNRAYQQVRLSYEHDRFEIKSSGGQWYRLDSSFSSSTCDAAYLALTLAAATRILEFVCPVAIDQGDARMDKARRTAYHELLRELAEKRQAFCIDNHPDSRSEKANTITLDSIFSADNAGALTTK